MTIEEKIKGDLLEAAAAAIRRGAQPPHAARNLAETTAFLAQGLKGKPGKTEELPQLLRRAIKKGEAAPKR